MMLMAGPKITATPAAWHSSPRAVPIFSISERSQLAAVQETLVNEMVKDLTDQIFNATVADW